MPIPSVLHLKDLTVPLPVFCPDATRGVVRSLDSTDLQQIGVPGVIVNTWHLHQQPGAARLRQLGGIKQLMNYPGLVISDSGGFQVFSLFHQDPNYGKITDEGLVTYTGPRRQHRLLFTPEDSIQMQFALGSDIMICLDEFSPPSGSPAQLETSVRRTLAWASRCQAEFQRQLPLHGFSAAHRPLLFGVIQGHDVLSLRRYCAHGLLEIGFDGYGLGGQVFTASGQLDLSWTAANTALTPDEFPRYALGFGKPDEIIALYHQGYRIFDCVLPTRDARHGRLYISPPPGASTQVYQFLHLDKATCALDQSPPDPQCRCHTCRHYSRAYLHHLLKTGDCTFSRLATIHNLHFYTQLMASLNQQNQPR